MKKDEGRRWLVEERWSPRIGRIGLSGGRRVVTKPGQGAERHSVHHNPGWASEEEEGGGTRGGRNR